MSEGGTRCINSERISRPLVALRKDLQGTQKQRAKQLHISEKAVYKEERGKTLLDIAFASEIYALYKMTAHEFLHEKLESDGKAKKAKQLFSQEGRTHFCAERTF